MASTETSLDVYKDRIRRAQSALVANGIDYLLVGPSSDLIYLTGFRAHVSERLNMLIVPRQGRPGFVVPVLESFLCRDRADLMDLYAWEETESPADLVAKVLGNVDGKRIAVADQLWSVFLLRVQAAVKSGNWESGSDIMRSLRMLKDAYEVDRLREVAHLTDAAWEEFIEGGPLSGLSEFQAIERLQGYMAKRGLKPGFGICASGPNSASPHHHTSDRVIQRGDVIIFDWGAQLDGYWSDITRTVVIGEPTDEFRKIYDIVGRANDATFAVARPGTPCEALDKAARDLITSEGYGPNFVHRVGHGLGLDVHEDPYLVGGNRLELAPGMVFSDEPGIYLDGRFGVRIEDAVVCTDNGAERLNRATKKITVMD